MEWIVIAGLGIAAVLDWRLRKVPNWLTFSMILTGILMQTIYGGTAGLKESVFGALLGIALLYLPFALGGMGGGDVKLMSAIGAFAGPLVLIKVFLASAIFGGVLSLFEIARKRMWRRTLKNLRDKIHHFLLTQRFLSDPESTLAAESDSAQTPYAMAIILGYLCIYFFKGG